MKITEDIRSAIEKACDSYGYGGQSRLAEKTGLSQSHISRYVNGTTREITLEVWEKLAPQLKPYINVTITNHGSNVNQSVGELKSSIMSDDVYLNAILKKFPELTDINKVQILKHIEELLKEQQK